jgi:two-component system, OmpR family, copper resistance phosphate regulon response regulator CusR
MVVWGMLSAIQSCTRQHLCPVRLLIVEDDEKTARALEAGLKGEQFSVSVARTGEEGFFLLNAEGFDLVVLDWMLPGRDGLEILKTLRARGIKTPDCC